MITIQSIVKEYEVKCPDCNSDALYKYGKTRIGKQRFVCLMCGKQFTPNAERCEAKGKPLCPVCGKLMHLYRIEGEIIRFRCSGYPGCRTFKKYRIMEEGNELLHS